MMVRYTPEKEEYLFRPPLNLLTTTSALFTGQIVFSQDKTNHTGIQYRTNTQEHCSLLSPPNSNILVLSHFWALHHLFIIGRHQTND